MSAPVSMDTEAKFPIGTELYYRTRTSLDPPFCQRGCCHWFSWGELLARGDRKIGPSAGVGDGNFDPEEDGHYLQHADEPVVLAAKST